ncbi:MAG: DnaJ domain-containing protein [Cytophagaceae bacterium]
MEGSYYKLLGVPQNASSDEIKRAFRRKAKELHPDVNPSPDAKLKFQQLTKAYETLTDRNKRYLYDQQFYTYHDPMSAYNRWVNMQKEMAEREERRRYQEFMENRERLRNSYYYYPYKTFIYLALFSGYIFGMAIIAACTYFILSYHFVLVFFLLPFICAGIVLMKVATDWFKESKKYF